MEQVLYQLKGKSTAICGVSVPDEVKNSPAFNRSLNVHYGIIHVGEDEIRRRLEARGWKEKLVDDNINWAKHLEKDIKAERAHYIVDGNKHNPQQVSYKFVDWILRETVDTKS